MKASIIIGLWILVVILPAICWRVSADLKGRITPLKKVDGADTATIIVQGMFGTPDHYWEEYAWYMPGDVFFLDWSSSPGFDPKRAAEHIVEVIRDGSYKRVHLITVSIGDMVTEPFGRLYWEWDTQYKHGWAVPPCPEVEIFPMDSFTNVHVVRMPLRLAFLIGAPVAIVIRWALGIFGSIPFIRIDNCWHSLGEIAEQFLAIATSAYVYKDAPIGRCIHIASISQDVWYMDASRHTESLVEVLPGSVRLLYHLRGTLCNINDPRYAVDLAVALHAADMYEFADPHARHPKSDYDPDILEIFGGHHTWDW